MTRRIALLVSVLLGLPISASALAQGPPDSIVAENVPPIPPELRKALEKYSDIRAATFQGWVSENGEASEKGEAGAGILISTRFGDTNQIHLVSKPGGDRKQLTFLRDRVPAALPRPGRQEFLFATDLGGAENYQFFVQPIGVGESLRLTNGKSRNLSPAWSTSGDLLAWSGNARNGKDMDIYVMAPADPKSSRLLKEVSGDWSVSEFSPDGRKVAVVQYVSINESYIHVIDIATGDLKTMTPKPEEGEETVSNTDPKWSPDGRSLYWISDWGLEFRNLWRYDFHPTGDRQTLLSADIEADVEEFVVKPSQGPNSSAPDNGLDFKTMFLVNEGGLSRLYNTFETIGGFVQEDLGGMRGREGTGMLGGMMSYPAGPAKALRLQMGGMGGIGGGMGRMRSNAFTTQTQPDCSGTRISRLAFKPDGSAIGLDLASSTRSSDAYVLTKHQLLGGIVSLKRWTESETAGLDTQTFVRPELIEFESFDEKMIPAFVYRPANRSAKSPVLIDIHGGPEAQFRPAFLGRLNYLINELGITLIFPNVRGSSGYGKSYLKLDNGMNREDSVQDIGALLDWIGTQEDLDAARVGVIGGSYGGYMVLASLTLYSDRIKAGIDIVGISNWVTFLQNTQGYRRDLRRAEYGDERDPKMKEYLEKISPLTNASKIKVPLLVAQGKNDPRVPMSEAEQIVKAVRKNGVPVWYILANDEGHGFAKKKNQDYLQAAEILFLKEYLLK